jgi:hypothetical protein
MIFGRSATLLPRLVLCLSLLASAKGLAQGAEELPPLVPSGESPEQPASGDEVIPREQEDDGAEAVRFAGRLLLQPPAGILAGAAGGIVGFFPVFGFSAVVCDVIRRGELDTDCVGVLTYAGTALSVALGAGLGVMGAGYLLDGRARLGAVLFGALAGSAVGGALARSRGTGLLDGETIILLWAGPVIGATLGYALSDVLFPDPSRRIRAVPPASEDEDEYALVLPVIGTTRTGGIIGGLAGRF